MEIRVILLVVCFYGIKESFGLTPPEAARPRYKRVAAAEKGPLNNEAMFQEMHEGLKHPFYSTIAKRPGEPTKTHSCGSIRELPAELRRKDVMRPKGLDPFYKKYTEAYGIPVISSDAVSDSALQRACYTLRFLLADNAKVRRAYYKMSGRVAVIGKNEKTNQIPEHKHLEDWWNERARGLGATWDGPISTAGEENALCLPEGEDRYYDDDIVLHEYLHGYHNLGLNYAAPKFEKLMERLYKETKEKGTWKNTYSMSTDREYFAEAGQSYLNSHTEEVPGNGIHNFVNTRGELKSFDRTIYNIFNHLFTCNNEYLPRCDKTKTSAQQREAELKQELKMDCKPTTTTSTKSQPVAVAAQTTSFKTSKPVATTAKQNTEEQIEEALYDDEDYESVGGDYNSDYGQETSCSDKNEHCQYWAQTGECVQSSAYMMQFCRKSCNQC